MGHAGLAVGIAGVIEMSLGSTPWMLAVGVIIWLAARCRDLDGVLLVPERASRTTTRLLVDAFHAHPRHDPPPIFGGAFLAAPRFAAAADDADSY